MIFKYEIYEDIPLLKYLQSFYASKSKIYTLFLEKRIHKNGNVCQQNTILNSGDILEIEYEEEIDYTPEEYTLDILYEDAYVLIINKPNGYVIHEKNHSICNMVAGYYKKKGYSLSIKFPHRLDKDTSGVLIFCKDMLTMSYFNHIVSTHEMIRSYLAIVEGYLSKKEGVLSFPIGEDRHHNQKRRVSKTGQTAITKYRVLDTIKGYSFVEALLETGRTHQIRVHFSHIGHPLLGDSLYGGNPSYSRTLLHSYKVEFEHPVYRKKIIIKCELPSDMREVLGENYVVREKYK